MKTERGVRVNEVGIFSNRHGSDWWVTVLAPWVRNGRALCLGMCPAGGVWYLPGGTKDDAEFMRDHIASHGVHAKCVTVTTRAKAEAERQSRVVADLEAS